MARKDTIVGLDVGRYAVKAVWAGRRGGDVVVKRAEMLRLPTDGSSTLSVVTPWLDKIGIGKTPCVVSLPGSETMFQPFLMPPGDPRTLKQAAEMEVLRFDELASESMVCGYAPFALAEGEKRLLLAMARQSVVDAILGFTRETKLNAVDIVPSPVALFNALGRRAAGAKDEPPVLYLDIGHTATAVAVGSSVGLMFARAFASGGQMFTEALATSRGLTANQAEHLKVTQESLAPGSAGEASLAPIAEMWVSEVLSCLSLYNLLFPGAACRIGRVVLAGGGSRLAGFAPWIGGKLKLPVTAAGGSPGLPNDAGAAEYAVATGLAMSGLDLGASAISLLPAPMKDELTFRRQKPFWIAAGVAAALILTVSLVAGSRDIRRRARYLGEQRANLSRRQDLVTRIESIKTQNEEIRRMAEPIRDMLRGAPVMRDLVTLVSRAKTPSDSITLICDAESYFAGRGPEKASRLPSAHTGRNQPQDLAAKGGELRFLPRFERVMIEGYTRKANLSSVRELISRIKEADFVESADLLSDDQLASPAEGDGSSRRGQRFVIDVRIAAHERSEA